MSKGFNIKSFSNFESVDNMNQTVREQQYAFNGRIFIPPNTQHFASDTGSYGGSDNNISQYYNGGMINFTPNESSKPYDLFTGSNEQQDTNVSIISNIVLPNSLSRTFFSNDNVERIQLQIINEVYKQSQKKIGKQSYQELQVIMKSIYLQYSQNLKKNIEEQVQKLNKYVIDDCVRTIVANVLQYTKYIEDITTPTPVRFNPQNVSNKGYKFGDFSSLIPPMTIN